MAHARHRSRSHRAKSRSAARPAARGEPTRTACPAAEHRRRSASCRRSWPGRRAAAAVGRSAGPLAMCRSCGLRRRAAVGGFLGELAEGEGPPAVDDEAVGGVAFARADVPAVGGGADQHRPGDRRGFAQRLLERADRGRSRRVCPSRMPDAGQPSSVRRAGWRRPGERRRLDRDVSQAAPSSSATICGSAGPDALPGLGLRHGDRDPAVARDLDEIAERLLAAPQRRGRCRCAAATARRRRPVRRPRPRRSAMCGDRRFKARTGPSSARRSNLPVPRRGSGSGEKMNALRNLEPGEPAFEEACADRPRRAARRPSDG